MSGRSISGLSQASAAFLAAVIFIIFFSAPAFAQRTYYVNGKTVSKSSYDAAFLVQEANDLMAAGNLGRASRKLRLALSYDPDFSVAHTNLGIILARQGKNSEALIHLQKSVKSPEAAPLAYMNLASFYQCTGNLDGSINTFNLLAGKETASSEMKDYAGNILKMLEKERAQRQKSKASSAKGASTPDYFAYAGANATARWTDLRMPLRVYIDPSTDAEGYKTQYGELLKKAFFDWETATKGKVRFLFVNARQDSDIDCFFTNDAEKLGNGAENGNATTARRGDTLFHAQIVLRSKEAEGTFPFNDNTVISTSRHEVGHALGLSWHSPNPDDLMYFSIPLVDREQNITERDRNTLLKLYSCPVSWTALLCDFISISSNLKSAVPVLAIVFILVALLIQAFRPGKKKLKKAGAGKNARTR